MYAVSSETPEQAFEKAKQAIDEEELEYFSGFFWKSYLSPGTGHFYKLFDYAVEKKSSRELKVRLMQECVGYHGIANVFSHFAGTTYHPSLINFLKDFLPKGKTLVSIRCGFANKSLLHVCAENGNEAWLRFFVENLEFKYQAPCWGDRYGLSPLYYGADRGHLGVARFLVLECGQSPTQASQSRWYKKTPVEIAQEGPVKQFLEECVAQRGRPQRQPVGTVPAAAQQPQQLVIAQEPVREVEAVDAEERRLPTETSPLLGRR